MNTYTPWLPLPFPPLYPIFPSRVGLWYIRDVRKTFRFIIKFSWPRLCVSVWVCVCVLYSSNFSLSVPGGSSARQIVSSPIYVSCHMSQLSYASYVCATSFNVIFSFNNFNFGFLCSRPITTRTTRALRWVAVLDPGVVRLFSIYTNLYMYIYKYIYEKVSFIKARGCSQQLESSAETCANIVFVIIMRAGQNQNPAEKIKVHTFSNKHKMHIYHVKQRQFIFTPL